MTEFKETDLYEPIRAFLEEEGYQVQAEVKHCDIAAEKNGRLVVVELKRAFGLKLVYQGLERQSLTDEVFVAIPRPKKGAREKAWQDMLRLLKRLELGLLTVALDSPLKTVDVVLTPADSMIRKNKRKKEQLQAELEGRQLDANIGGMTRRKIITAYRERVIRLACILEREGKISLAELRARGLEELAVLLGRNYEKWFVRVEKGVYALSEKGKTDEQKEKDRLRKRQLKQTRIENGLCPRCGKHQSQNGGLCQRCRAYLKNYRDKNRCDLSRSERPDYGICYICGKNPTMKGKKVCDKCYETRLSTLPAMWENANNDYFRQLNYARFCMIKNQRKEKTSGSDFNV